MWSLAEPLALLLLPLPFLVRLVLSPRRRDSGAVFVPEAIAAAMAEANVASHVDGAELRKVIYVPGRMLNLIT